MPTQCDQCSAHNLDLESRNSAWRRHKGLSPEKPEDTEAGRARSFRVEEQHTQKLGGGIFRSDEPQVVWQNPAESRGARRPMTLHVGLDPEGTREPLKTLEHRRRHSKKFPFSFCYSDLN